MLDGEISAGVTQCVMYSLITSPTVLPSGIVRTTTSRLFQIKHQMNTDRAWDEWGLRDPYYGVLTDPKFRTAALTSQSRAEFFASGTADAAQVLARCHRCAGQAYEPRRILDFGCGVGRVLIPFARMADEVVGIDIAPSMIAEAKRNCLEFGVTNVTFLGSDESLSFVDGYFDLVHSSIVLQHIDIPRGRALFAALVNRIAPGGCGVIHVTFGWTAYADSFGFPPVPPPKPRATIFSILKSKLRIILDAARSSVPISSVETDPEMLMNFYNLSEIMFIIQQVGIKNASIDFTNHGGALGANLSFQKEP